MNSVVLIGRLVRQPELRITQSGISVTNATLAVDRRRAANGEQEADFVDVVIWGKQAEATCEYMDKGLKVAVRGRLESRVWETQEGQRRKSWEVVAEEVKFLEWRADHDE